jgi:hypothetical protein
VPFLEQIERKLKAMQNVVSIFRKLREEALEDFHAQEKAREAGVGSRWTIGVKLPEGLHGRLELVAKKYGVKSKKRAVLLAINAGCRALLNPEDLNVRSMDDIEM